MNLDVDDIAFVLINTEDVNILKKSLMTFILSSISCSYDGDEISENTTRFYRYNAQMDLSQLTNVHNACSHMINMLNRSIIKYGSYSHLNIVITKIDKMIKLCIDIGISDPDIIKVSNAFTTLSFNYKEAEILLYDYIRDTVLLNYLGDVPIRSGKVHQQSTTINKSSNMAVYIYWIRDVVSWLYRSIPKSGYSLLTIKILCQSDIFNVSIEFQT